MERLDSSGEGVVGFGDDDGISLVENANTIDISVKANNETKTRIREIMITVAKSYCSSKSDEKK